MLEWILALIIVAYLAFDVNYFIQIIVTILIARFYRPKISPLETSITYGIALPSDVDTTLDHMNNARVLREFDYGRIAYGIRTGVATKMISYGGGFPINCNFVRYRLPIKPFSKFMVETRLLHWDQKQFFLEQKMTTLDDGIVRAVAYPKLTCAMYNGNQIMDELCPGVTSPGLDEFSQKINEICEIVSDRFKKRDSTDSPPSPEASLPADSKLNFNTIANLRNETDQLHYVPVYKNVKSIK